MKQTTKAILIGLGAAGIPAKAFAHVGVGDVHGFVHGFWHPLSGADHLLAMIAVGMFAASLGGRALWLVPAAFVAMMAIGGMVGIAGIPLPFVEIGIGASVVVLGLAVALNWSLSILAAMTLVGFFAVFHGHAHGTEMPVAASGLTYGLGFILATATLHALGIAIGLGIGSVGARLSRFNSQAGGGAMALAGLGMLAGFF
ncbi:MAG: HupE/UreJ family protein [Rhizobiaceae bacterium]|nr:HupE/UreJ family protein [Rhizobiaceae bacterium]